MQLGEMSAEALALEPPAALTVQLLSINQGGTLAVIAGTSVEVKNENISRCNLWQQSLLQGCNPAGTRHCSSGHHQPRE